jgi:dTDP-4-dehydrorhamnose reductase
MRVLVVGRQGQLANALTQRLPLAGHQVRALGRDALDITSADAIAAALDDFDAEAVVNAAAYTAVDKAEDEPALAHAVNATAPGLLAAAAAARGLPLLHYSTDYVFDGSKPAPYTEADATNPLGVYGASKLAGELAVLGAHPAALVLRTAWVCSAHGTNFVKTMLRLGRERPELGVVTDQLGAPSFADDLADASASLLARLAAGAPGGAFHFSGLPHTSWHGFAEAIFAGAARRGQPAPVLNAITSAQYPTRARRPTNSRLDSARIGAVHGLAAPDWRPALERCLDALLGPAQH